MKRLIIIFSAMIMLSSGAYAAELPSAARAEITHLLDYLAASGCEFYRNGTWYNGADARAHLEKKFQYLLKKNLIKNAEDFIAKAATESSMSGEDYKVRCGNDISASAGWLTAELTRLRHKQQTSP
jgi:hypothetical protein